MATRETNGLASASVDSMQRPESLQYRTGSILLAIAPVVSFVGQYLLSLRAGTTHEMFRHLTLLVADWVLVPFNFFVVRVIDWRRGGRLYVITCISVTVSALTHAFWQYHGDVGHMITSTGVVLPGGWLHIVFSTSEIFLLVAFIFCRKAQPSGATAATVSATVYFLTMGICGYVMHRRFIASDVGAFVPGLFFVLVYPALVRHRLRE